MSFASWRMVLKRMRSDSLIVAAAVVTIVLAVVLLAAGPIYADAVTVAGAQRKLIDAPVTEANVAVTHRVEGSNYAASDNLVTREANRVLAPIGGDIVRSGQSEPYRLPDEILSLLALSTDSSDSRTRQTVLEFREGIESHATIVDGRWPAPDPEVIEVVLPAGAAELLGLAPDDELSMINRLNANLSLDVRIVGIYRANNPDDRYWNDELLPVEGANFGESVVVIGPFLTHQDAFVSTVMVRLSTVDWRALPTFTDLQLVDVPPTRGALGRLEDRLEDRATVGTPYQVSTGLGPLLAEIDRGLLAARSGVFILTLQLAILAGYALVLTANLLTEVRSVEMALLRSRGAGVWQVAGFSLLEGLMLVLPAVLIGPWLAAQGLKLLNVAGPLASINLNLEPQVNQTSYMFAGLAGLGCLLVLVIPSLLAARSILGARAARGREAESPLLQRAGADLALVAIAGLGFFQLRRFGTPLTETVRGRLELDPLLIAAPALGLVAGAVLALRLIPLFGRLAERVSTRGNRLVTALGSWQVSRRPGRYARSALLLMLALGIGLFAVSFSRTWTDSQADQANQQIGAGIVVLPNRTDSSLPAEHLGPAYEEIEGVTAAMPVSTGFANIPISDRSGQTIMLDSTRANDIVTVRDDFADATLPELMAPLEAGRPEIEGIPIPGEPRRMAFDVKSTITRFCTEPELAEDQVGAPGVHVYESFVCQEHPELSPHELLDFEVPITPSIIVQDERDQFYRFTAAPLESSDEVQRVVFDIATTTDVGLIVRPLFPIKLVEVELRTAQAPSPLARSATFSWSAVHLSDATEGEDWTQVDLTLDALEWEFTPEPVSGDFTRLEAVRFPEQRDLGDLAIDMNPGVSTSTILGFGQGTAWPISNTEFSFRLKQPERDGGIPIIVSERLLAEIAFNRSSSFRLLIGGEDRPVIISGLLRSFPSIDPDDELIIVVDGPTVDNLRFLETGVIQFSFESWWLGVEPEASDDIAELLEEAPYFSNEVTATVQRTRELRTDPVALGTLGALTLGFVAAIVFAIVGFVSSAIVGARERMTEFALLRAIGLSSRQLAGWLLVENGFLVLLSLLGGTLLGFLLSWLILPLITVNREAEQVFPSLIVVIPWRTIFMLEAVILLLLLIVSAIMAIVLRQVGLGTALRIGEE